jgi:hypothetical protein
LSRRNFSAAFRQQVEDGPMSKTSWLIAAVIWFAGALAARPTQAQGLDFRVDTELFENQEKTPFLETLTIFADSTVYDFRLTKPQETAVFDLRRGLITLLDESRNAKSSVTTQDLLDYCLALETHAAQEKDRLFAFCAVPQFETTDKPLERNGQSLIELRLTAKPLTYTAEGQQPERTEAAKSYRHFSDWCARLNATRAGGMPPGARLALNQALAERELLPYQILKVTPASGPLGKKLELRSEHRFNWTRSGEDQKKIDHASDLMATLPAISYVDFCSKKAPPLDWKQARK